MLGYLPTNPSRPEIASQLSVSVNTVKTRIRSIYAKLQAQDRSLAYSAPASWLRSYTALALGRRGEPVDRDVGRGLGGELGPGPVGVPRL